MNFLKSLIKEIKSNTSSTYARVAIVAILTIPLLYGALYLKAFWDPYQKINEIPVAVVNLDKGYNLSGSEINTGNELVKELKSNQSLNWNFVSKEQAESGLRSKKYYATITIPSDFSANIYSVESDSPKKALIEYSAREATNYLATNITTRVSDEIANSLSKKIVSKYFDNIFLNIESTASELQRAADGANKLQNGLDLAVNGTNNLTDGFQKTINGNETITDGLESLNKNQQRLSNGLSEAVEATSMIKSGADKIFQSQTQIKSGVDSMSVGLQTLANATSQSKEAITQSEFIIENYIANHPESASELSTVQQILSMTEDGLSQTEVGTLTIKDKTAKLSDAIEQTKNGQAKISDSLTTISQKLQLAGDGSKKIENGSQELLTGVTKIGNGLADLNYGTISLKSGLNSANDGAGLLKNELSKGAEQVDQQAVKHSDSNVNQIMSNPISINDKSFDLVSNYGSSLAPYFISLALWVGGIMTFFVIDFNKKAKNKKDVIIKYSMLCLVGIIQSIILDTVLIKGLGLNVENPFLFYNFSILVSLSFMSILQLLIHNFDNIGRYLAIVLLVLQLTSGAGTFPKETLPQFFQIINPLLPMTYSISGIRDLIFTKEIANLILPVLYFLTIITICNAINIILAKKRARKFRKKVI